MCKLPANSHGALGKAHAAFETIAPPAATDLKCPAGITSHTFARQKFNKLPNAGKMLASSFNTNRLLKHATCSKQTIFNAAARANPAVCPLCNQCLKIQPLTPHQMVRMVHSLDSSHSSITALCFLTTAQLLNPTKYLSCNLPFITQRLMYCFSFF